MNGRLCVFLSALVGVVCGFITIHSPLAHSWMSAIFWVVIGLIIIYFSPNRRTAVFAATIFSYLNIASWLLSGFQGTTAQLPGILTIILIAGTLCALVGAGGAFLFYWLFRRQLSK